MENELSSREELHRLRRDWLIQTAITEGRLADLTADMSSLVQQMKKLAEAQARTEAQQEKTNARWDSLMEMLGRQQTNGGTK